MQDVKLPSNYAKDAQGNYYYCTGLANDKVFVVPLPMAEQGKSVSHQRKSPYWTPIDGLTFTKKPRNSN